jgi:hypothetical protein
MIASVLIIGISFILLLYWFRYSCTLLLRSHALEESADERFSFAVVLERLRGGAGLDPLHHALDRDYRVLTYLLEHAATLDGGFEERVLVLDYRLMQCWYRLTKSAAPRLARKALAEMASVLAVLSGKLNATTNSRAAVHEA